MPPPLQTVLHAVIRVEPWAGSQGRMRCMTFDATRLKRIETHFQRYVDDGRLPGFQILVGQHGKVDYSCTYGMADREAGRAVEEDTQWRIYSMTKPIVSVAAMLLW